MNKFFEWIIWFSFWIEYWIEWFLSLFNVWMNNQNLSPRANYAILCHAILWLSQVRMCEKYVVHLRKYKALISEISFISEFGFKLDVSHESKFKCFDANCDIFALYITLSEEETGVQNIGLYRIIGIYRIIELYWIIGLWDFGAFWPNLHLENIMKISQ